MTEKNSSKTASQAAKDAAKQTAKSGTGLGDDGAPNDAGLTSLSFEQSMAEIERVVGQLERADVPLAESLAAYQRGAALMRHAQALLNQVQADIEVIESGKTSRISRSALVSQIKD
jgi:exodeoxyribonuclease VII small subunit